MMKATSLIRNLIVLVFCHYLKDSFATDVIFTGNNTWGKTKEDKFSSIAQEHLANLEKIYLTKKIKYQLQVQVMPPSLMKGHWARTTPDSIYFSSEIPKGSLAQIFKHEVSHYFLLNVCKDKIPIRNQLIHESFAQWVSGDYYRLLENNRFHFLQDAHTWFRKYDWDNKQDSSTLEAALARIIASINPTILDDFFKKLVTNCTSGNLKTNEWNSKLAEIFNFNSEFSVKKSKLDYLLIDGFSKKTLKEEGLIDHSYPMGSTLKPLIISLYPELTSSRLSRNTQSWMCPSPSNFPRRWTWTEALINSCNGFFLDAPIQSLDRLNNLFAMLNINYRSHSMADAIGLVPKIKMSLRQMLMIYSWMELTNPLVLEPLKETSFAGTLANLPASNWFYQRGISLKSGTIRDAKSRPLHGWIVALGPKDSSGIASFMAAIHAEGASPKYLLNELKKRLQEIKIATQPIEVGLFNLIPDNQINLRCNKNQPLMIGQVGNWRSSFKNVLKYEDFRPKERYHCLGGPLLLSFPTKKKTSEERPYFGTLEFIAPPSIGKDRIGKVILDEKQVRARSTSRYKLHTSLRYYLWGVLAAEFPKGQNDAMKALAIVVKHNLKYFESTGKTICDNTYCQVFGPNQNMPTAISLKIQRAVEESINSELVFPDGYRWLYFSLGGTAPWKRTISSREIEKRIMISKIQDIEVNNYKITLNNEVVLNCDTFQNQIKLPSCPEKIIKTLSGWSLSGKGEGHARGLNVVEANTFAAQGKNQNEILKHYFPDATILTY